MRSASHQDARVGLAEGFWPSWAVLIFVGWSLLMAPAQSGQRVSGVEAKQEAHPQQVRKGATDRPGVRDSSDF